MVNKWIVPDDAGQTLRVGDSVTVHDEWNPKRLGQQGEIIEIQRQPHHAILVKFCDGATDWVLAGLVHKV